MSFEQIFEILGIVNRSHERVYRFCTAVEFDDANEHVQLLITSLREDQLRLQQAMTQSALDPSRAVSVESWVQFVPYEELEASVQHVLNLQTPSIDEFAAAIGNFYRAIGLFIARVKEQSASEGPSRVLDELAFLENQKAKALTARLAGLRDI